MGTSGQGMYTTRLSEAYLLAGQIAKASTLAEQALALARERKQRGFQAGALRLLGEIASQSEPRRLRQPKPTTSRLSPWPRHSACARSRPTAIAVSAPCTS